MPLRSVQTGPEHHVFVRSCDGCNSPHAPWGTGSLHEAIRTKDPSKVKCWCGPNGCQAISSVCDFAQVDNSTVSQGVSATETTGKAA